MKFLPQKWFREWFKEFQGYLIHQCVKFWIKNLTFLQSESTAQFSKPLLTSVYRSRRSIRYLGSLIWQTLPNNCKILWLFSRRSLKIGNVRFVMVELVRNLLINIVFLIFFLFIHRQPIKLQNSNMNFTFTVSLQLWKLQRGIIH